MQSELIDRIQPNNLEAERAALGAAILDRNAFLTALECLDSEDFYDPGHARAFDVLKSMARRDKAVDTLTFEEELSRQNLWEKVGGSSFTTMLIDAVTTTANIEHYCAIVRGKSIHRALIRAGAEIIRSGYAEEGEATDSVAAAEKKIFEIMRHGAGSSYKEIKEVVEDVFSQIQRNKQDGAFSTYVMSGFKDLDNLIGGFQPGSLVVIAARPSVGKTALALNIAAQAAIQNSVPTMIFSLEMSAEQVASRMLSALSRVNVRELETSGKIDNAQWTDITNAASQLCNAPIFIDDSSTLSTFELRARCRRFKSRFIDQKCLVVVDYLQLMTSDSRRMDNRNQEVADISRMLKGVAREFEFPVIALSQLNRKADEREGGKRTGRPSLSNLRDSGAIEQDADIVAFLDRKSYQDLDSLDNTAEISVQKHRNGPTGRVNLVFYREFSRFENFTR